MSALLAQTGLGKYVAIIRTQRRSQILLPSNVYTKPLIDICIPTYDNYKLLQGCLQSILENTHPRIYRILIANNGTPKILDSLNRKDGLIKVYDIGENAGWEGGINYLLGKAESDFILMLNDDTHIPPNDPSWLLKMLTEFRDPKVGAVGPSSNYVMQKQNIFWQGLPRKMNVSVLIGMCMMIRKSVLTALNGLTRNLPGGDDLDLSIRLESSGYKLRVTRDVFVYHHGAQTGRKVFGNYWDSELHQDRTNIELIKRNGFKQFLRCRQGVMEPVIPDQFKNNSNDSEGDLVRSYIIGEKILDIGCGSRKTIEKAIGVDVFPKGELIPSLEHGDKNTGTLSQADVVAMSDNLPFHDDDIDTVIARHILEHSVNIVRNIREWGRVLIKGGRLIIAVPDESKVKGIPLNPEHFHAFTKESIADLMSACLPNFDKVSISDSKNGVSLVSVYDKVS